ncbi:MAG: HDIG domain-containing protein [Phycisphaerae bacterium]
MLLLQRLTVVQQLSRLSGPSPPPPPPPASSPSSSRIASPSTLPAARRPATPWRRQRLVSRLFLLMIAVGVLVFPLGDLRSRMRLIQVGLISALVAGAMAFAVGLTQEQALGFVATQAGIGAAATLLACCAVMVLLPVIERFFGVATSMTLLEWADTSSPLLRQLIQKAPGTWQHSHLLGSLAESAAEEIAANSLLVRVGAYYHDIGKMCKPEYFVENQSARQNVHNRLAPHMSLLVIVGHVKDGLALAVEHGLPRVLHQFIAEHHGTTLVKYFHHLAARQAERQRNGDRPIDDAEFRYPGPKPRTRESAILMLADSVEGAVRSLSEPTPSRIEAVVHEICMARLMDGQLDDCDITLKELARIEQSLVRSLCSIYHGRIAYPATEPEPDLVGQTRTA